MNDWQAAADFVHGDFENTALLFRGARGDLGRMRVDRYGRQALNGCDIAQMAAEAVFVDRKIVLEWQQHRGDDAMGHVVGKFTHVDLLSLSHAGR